MIEKTNINTYVMVAGFLLTLGANYGAYVAFEARTALQLSETKTTLAEMKIQRSTDIARMDAKTTALEASIQNLFVQDARQIEQINAMLSYLQRIDRTLEQLVKEQRDDR